MQPSCNHLDLLSTTLLTPVPQPHNKVPMRSTPHSLRTTLSKCFLNQLNSITKNWQRRHMTQSVRTHAHCDGPQLLVNNKLQHQPVCFFYACICAHVHACVSACFCVCMCVYVGCLGSVCMCVCVRVRMPPVAEGASVCVCVCATVVCEFARMCVCTVILMHACVYILVCVCMRVHACMCVRVHMHTQ